MHLILGPLNTGSTPRMCWHSSFQDAQGARAFVLWVKAEGAGLIQPGEDMDLGRL